jgi:hypothetical protein
MIVSVVTIGTMTASQIRKALRVRDMGGILEMPSW